jgi:hypothetical protein
VRLKDLLGNNADDEKLWSADTTNPKTRQVLSELYASMDEGFLLEDEDEDEEEEDDDEVDDNDIQ